MMYELFYSETNFIFGLMLKFLFILKPYSFMQDNREGKNLDTNFWHPFSFVEFC